jgi:hypothetical protein
MAATEPEPRPGDERAVKIRGQEPVFVWVGVSNSVVVHGDVPRLLTADEAVELGQLLQDCGKIAARRKGT